MAARRIARRDLPDALRVAPGTRFRLRDPEASRTFGWAREEVELATRENLARLSELQYKMFADGRFSMLVVLQAIDGGGKDSTIRRVFSAFNPQGCSVTAFKVPSEEERRHDFLWRIHRRVPARGEVAVFNRSHYEDVLVVRVENLVPEAVWSRRYAQINDFESMLVANDTRVVKVFLQISREEQKRRFEERLAERSKQWKFDPGDLDKRARWDDYRVAFEAALSRCSTESAPWYAIPADRKWFRDFAVSQLLRQELERLPLRWPKPAFDARGIRIV
ncbi:MAG: polyphosphate kinase 2 family protein [Steroidobacteraceae bacterium]|jgi:PPK2 family polyphosphate:nucleotide phosphotransferase|nr:polyphosphate kinase 2 family protein [Steroidobacteraceae bacterium]